MRLALAIFFFIAGLVCFLCGCSSYEAGHQHYLEEQKVHIASPLEWYVEHGLVYRTNEVQTNEVWIFDLRNTPESYFRYAPTSPVESRADGIEPKIIHAFSQSVATPTLPPIARAITNFTLVWIPSADPAAVAYNLYYGVTPGEYLNRLRLGNVTNVTIGNLPTGYTWYFAATAMDEDNYEGAFSDELAAATPLILDLRFPDPGIALQSSTDLVTWSDRAAAMSNGTWTVVATPGAPQEFYRPTP